MLPCRQSGVHEGMLRERKDGLRQVPDLHSTDPTEVKSFSPSTAGASAPAVIFVHICNRFEIGCCGAAD
jgi:hypothetical protein